MIGPWRRLEYRTEERGADSDFGHHSKVWTYSAGSLPAVVSFDYPFSNWHELTGCYEKTGWFVVERELHQGADGWCYVKVHMVKPTGEHGSLWFSLFDEAGDGMAPPGDMPAWKRVVERSDMAPVWALVRGKGLARNAVRDTSYQFQLFVSGSTELTKRERDCVQQQFLGLRSTLQKQWVTEVQREPGS